MIFSVGCDIIDSSNFVDIHKCTIKKDNVVQIPGFIKQMFIVLSLILLLLEFDGSLTTICVFLKNQPCTTKLMFINFNLVELHYYPFMVSLH